MANYKNLSKKLENLIENDKLNGTMPRFFCSDNSVIRRKDNEHDNANVWRTAFIRDIDKILNCPFYNRYTDKTQVFSLYKNDDISRRALHVQLVSRTARTIGKALNLNLDLIEAISLGHDMGHTPFGHAGEKFLDELYRNHTDRRFNHNIHSVRVLDKIFPLNLSLQTLDGIACHNGEIELNEYRPAVLSNFDKFDKKIEDCYIDSENVLKMIPSTLEGAVMRISDIIAYLGKDRQDAEKSRLLENLSFNDSGIGVINSEIVNNLMVNIIENSYNKPYIKMDKECFDALNKAKRDNYEIIYLDKAHNESNIIIKQMMEEIYNKLLCDLINGNLSSPVYKHHIEYINKPYYKRDIAYEETEKNQIVVDYIASMTDDYFIELHKYLFPKSNLELKYKGYFE
ncbi:MAG: HD domain-containing protein [Clostridia bacterium]|nr:HD domain-containing protein [Clostridia bacterium]